MSRKGPAPKREALPDPVYGSQVLTKLVNQIMHDGKRSIAEAICYGALKIIQEKTGRQPLEVLDEAIKNLMPLVETRPRRVGGANYQVPMEVRPERRQTLAIRWLTIYSRQRAGRTMEEKLAAEIMDAAAGAGGAFKKKEDTHRMAEANKAFAHYRW